MIKLVVSLLSLFLVHHILKDSWMAVLGILTGRVLRSFLERSRSASGANLANGSLL